MKKIIALTLLAFLTGGMALAQHGNCGNCPHHAKHQSRNCQPRQEPQVNADGIDMLIVRAFPTVKSVKANKKWTEVRDADNKLLGYAVYSKPASDSIRGYAGETPVLIALDAKQVITGVYLLPNSETPKFIQHVAASGFFGNWNGLTVKQAKKQKVDTVSGATFTSRAVALSVKAALEKL